MFDEMLMCSAGARRLSMRWSKNIPALVRMPLFSMATGFGYVVLYKEKVREYILQCFDPDTGGAQWETNVRNGGYGSHAIGEKTVAIPTSFVDITGIDAVTGGISWVHRTNSRVRSPISYVSGEFVFSSGQDIYRLTEMGEMRNVISLPGHFFYGLVRVVGGDFYSLSTFTNSSGKSQLALVALSFDGRLRWKVDLGEGQIVSSDTSGFLVAGGFMYCAAGRFVRCISMRDGENTWSVKLPDVVGRQIPSIADGKLFVPSIKGRIFCLRINDGSLRWAFRGETIATTPVSILGDLACVCLDGQLHLLDIETGRLFDKIPTGHSPYSAVTFWQEKAYLGGGDPPYHGRLYCFDFIDRLSESEYACSLNSYRDGENKNSLCIEVTVRNARYPVVSMTLDGSFFSALKTNGGVSGFSPVKRGDDKFVFEVPIREGIVPGIYCVDFDIFLGTEGCISRVGLVSIESDVIRPQSHVIKEIKPRFQTGLLNSGAAAMQMLQEYYGQPVTDQDAIRGMVDYVREKADYESFNVWRIMLRRVISSNAQSKEFLPEYLDI